MVCADIVNVFNNRLDKFWSDQEVLYLSIIQIELFCLFVCLSSPSSTFPASRMRALTPLLASTGPYGVTSSPLPLTHHVFN